MYVIQLESFHWNGKKQKMIIKIEPIEKSLHKVEGFNKLEEQKLNLMAEF